MHYFWLIGAILILLVILCIVIFLIVREVIQRNPHQHHDRQPRRHVGFRMIRSQSEFDEFRQGIYVPRAPSQARAPDSGIDESHSTPGSGDTYGWSTPTSAASTPSTSGSVHDMSRRIKSVSFADSIDFSRIDYDQSSKSYLPDLAGIMRTCDKTDPKLTSYSSSGRNFRVKRKPTPSNDGTSAYDMKHDDSITERLDEEHEIDLIDDSNLPVTTL